MLSDRPHRELQMATLLELRARLAKTQAPRAQVPKAQAPKAQVKKQTPKTQVPRAQAPRDRLQEPKILQIPIDRSPKSSYPSILKPAWRSVGRSWVRNIDPINRDEIEDFQFDPDLSNVLILSPAIARLRNSPFYLAFTPSEEDDEYVRRMLRSARPAPDEWFGELYINPVNPHALPMSGDFLGKTERIVIRDGVPSVKIGFFESTGKNPYQYESINAGFAAGERFLQIPKNERRRMMFDAGLIELHLRYQVMQEGKKADREQERMYDELYGISQSERDERDKGIKERDALFAAKYGKWP